MISIPSLLARGASVLVVALAAWGPIHSVAAQPTGSADAAIARGIDLRKQGRDDEALAEFQRAHDLAPTPRAKAQIALAEQAVGRWVEAERHLLEALRFADDPWIVKQQSILTETLAVIRRRLGTLAVRGEPRGAGVEVDGRGVGTLPLSDTRVVAGEVAVTVGAPGYVSVTRRLTVPAGGRSAEIFTLKRLESDPLVRGAPVDLAPRPDAPPTEALSSQPSPPARADGWKRAVGWSAAGAAALTLAGAVTFHLLSRDNLATFNDETRGCGVDESNRVIGGPSCEDLHESWEQDRTFAVVGYVAAGAFAVTSAIFFLTATPRSTGEPQPPERVACLPTGPAALSCALRF